MTPEEKEVIVQTMIHLATMQAKAMTKLIDLAGRALPPEAFEEYGRSLLEATKGEPLSDAEVAIMTKTLRPMADAFGETFLEMMAKATPKLEA